MTIRPGNSTFVVNASSIIVDDFKQSFETQEFERLEFDHTKLTSSRLQNSGVAQIVQMLGGVSAEVIINDAVPAGYGGRPVVPNVYTSDWSNVKQSIDIKRVHLVCQNPENANIDSTVQALYALYQTHKKKVRSFQTRLQMISGDMNYQQLELFQLDNIQTLYFTTGIAASGPGWSTSQGLITEFNFGLDFAVPNGAGGYQIYRNFDLTIEERTVESAI